MVFLKKSSLTFGKASSADRADQTEPCPPFCAILGADKVVHNQSKPLQEDTGSLCCCASPSCEAAVVITTYNVNNCSQRLLYYAFFLRRLSFC